MGLSGDYSGNSLAFENEDGSIILQLLNPFNENQEITFTYNNTNYNFEVKLHSFNTLIVK